MKKKKRKKKKRKRKKKKRNRKEKKGVERKVMIERGEGEEKPRYFNFFRKNCADNPMTFAAT